MKKLEMKFLDQENKTVTLSLDDPKEPVDPVQVNQAMDAVLAENCFFSSNGDLVAKKEARIVERNVEDIVL
ncbi:DUF2922 domain-containing protein [Halobacillus salinarum]|uniref:DUF2922 domain-containing protein n=1 Tax=Halobacillus salinarum TaxID=2932257 RepID=A0ABY4EFJ5_9BACI|nr:DUF2922 domain-containing protein [Halobacillus salinarum]UOQ43238.1 DUF2922 domain-containing protein [Halobacillus salinarum]